MKVTVSNDVELEVRKPTAKQLADAQAYSAKVFVKLINEKDDEGKPTAIFRSKLVEHMEKLGMWTKEDDDKLEQTDRDVAACERQLGETRSKTKARELALEIRRLRGEKYLLITRKNQLDLFTVEAQVENAKFDYLVSTCVFNSDGGRYFKSVEDYQERANEPDASKVAMELSKIMYGMTEGFQDKLIENKVLKKIGAVDDKYRLVKDGKLVDIDGKPIDEDGYYLNEAGVRVDDDGNPLEVNIDDIEYTEE